jgi:hypothetical protein
MIPVVFRNIMIIRKVRRALWLIKYFGFNALLSIFTHELREPIIIKCNGDEVEATPYMLRWLLHAMDLGYVQKRFIVVMENL